MDKMPRRNDGKISEFPFVSLIYPLLPVFHPSTVLFSLSLSLCVSVSLSLSLNLHPLDQRRLSRIQDPPSLFTFLQKEGEFARWWPESFVSPFSYSLTRARSLFSSSLAEI